MGRSEARIFVTMWKDRDYRAGTVDEQWLYEALISQPDLNHLGVMPYRPTRWAALAADATLERVDMALVGLTAKDYTIIDAETGELFVRSLMRRDRIYRQPNLMKAAAAALADVESEMIRCRIGVELRRILDLDDVHQDSRRIVLEMLAELESSRLDPSPNPSGNPSANPSTGPLGERGRVNSDKYVDPSPPSPATLNPGGGGKTATNSRAKLDLVEPPNNEPPGPAEKILTEWRSALPSPVQPKIMDQLGATVFEALHAGVTEAHVIEGLHVWQSREDVGPGMLATFIHQVSQHVPSTDLVIDDRARSPNHLRVVGRTDRRESTTDARVNGNLALVAELELEEQT